MSRLSELISQLKRENPDLGKEIEKEVRHLQDRRAFGLNFERHRPETVELYGRPVRKGDKVKMLPPRGETKSPDDRLWIVTGAKRADGGRVATLKDRRADETAEYPLDDLVVVAESHDTIYPGLVSTGKIERGGDKPFHTVINAENLHALKLLLYTHRGKVDCIYIDPPYNTGARDWKYSNDYVESDDIYRHSKWLAFMERRLLVAKDLLNPSDSVLIVTIDEKEVHRLGLMLEQLFPESRAQLVTIVISPLGQERGNQLARVEEYAYFLFFGRAAPSPLMDDLLNPIRDPEDGTQPVRWERLIRGGGDATRRRSPDLFYPVFIDPNERSIKEVGDAIPRDADRHTVKAPHGTVAVWPLRQSGEEGRWRCSPDYLRSLVVRGYARVGDYDADRDQWTISYLGRAQIGRVERGEIEIVGRGPGGEVVLGAGRSMPSRISPKTVWNRPSHRAGEYGTSLIRALIPGRVFPYPKSLYAVEDALRVAVADKRDALILDFFSGSGTTAHAAMRLNRQDGGRRQSISVTNNEVAADEVRDLRHLRLRPGDAEWDAWGISEYITKPRIRAAIGGTTPEGAPVVGAYKFNDEFPMADGFTENAEFFDLTYEAPLNVATHHAFGRIAPMLWLRAGAIGRRIDDLEKGWDVADTYGVISDLDHLEDFREAINAGSAVKIAYIVTDDDRQFAATCSALPEQVEPVRLYESYLRNFQIDARRSSR